MTLLKGYFSMFINNKLLNTRYISKFFIRRSASKIFVGRGELKHTSDKVIITFYVHNTEKLSLKRKFLKLYKSFYSPKKKYVKKIDNKKIYTYLNEPLKRFITIDQNGDIIKDMKGREVIIYNRPYTVDEFLNSPRNIPTVTEKIDLLNTPLQEIKEITKKIKQITYNEAYCSTVESLIDKVSIYLKALSNYFEYLTKLVEIKVLSNHEKFLMFIKIANNFNNCNYPDYHYSKNIAEKRYKKNLYRLRYLFKFNSVKFEKPFIMKLTHLVEKIYDKKIEFNVVNLRQMHLSSDILTQALVLQLKDRNRMFSRIFFSSLNKVNLPKDRFSDRVNVLNKNEFLINKIRNTYISDMINTETIKTDSLNKVLLNYFPSANTLEIENILGKNPISIKDYVLKHLKHSKLFGVRLEAKGRLSKRFTAARSLYKLN
jgi:hypothetical protein